MNDGYFEHLDEFGKFVLGAIVVVVLFLSIVITFYLLDYFLPGPSGPKSCGGSTIARIVKDYDGAGDTLIVCTNGTSYGQGG